MRSIILLILLVSSLFSCGVIRHRNQIVSENLEIEKISKQIFVHRSFLQFEDYGKIGCNGMIYINHGEALIFDTPSNDLAAQELITYTETKLNAKAVGVIVNRFHVGCLGGLKTFHDKGIPSYSSNRTQINALNDSISKPVIPQNGFDTLFVFKLGDKEIINRYFGEGHTTDNIVSYVPSEKTLFGGCLIKEVGAGKGNLADANILNWSETVSKVKMTYPEVKYVVPGHGKVGGTELLDYTIKLFSR